MAESTLPAQSPAILESAPAALSDAPSEVIAIEKAQINGESTIINPTATAEETTATAPPTKPTTAVPEPAPIQTTTGDPNGTNGADGADLNSTTPSQPSTSDEDTPLFSASLISPEVAALLPEGYTMRPLRRSDYNRGFLDTLRVLTTVGSPNYSTFSTHFNLMASIPSTYHILVILDSSSTIVGTGAVIVERKFIHNMGLVGHIEDIAVAKNQQGKKLGLRIIQALDYVAEKVGCYKCILDCSEANEGFYVKCGFKRAGLEMAHYYGRD